MSLLSIPLIAQAVATLNSSYTFLYTILTAIKQGLALLGALVILTGAIYALVQFIKSVWAEKPRLLNFDSIRLDLGRTIILGLEFIIAADVIETTTAPDYYALGILGLLVVIRTFLNFSLNRDLNELVARESKDVQIQGKQEKE